MCSRAAPFNALALNWPSAGAALAPGHLVALALFGPETRLVNLDPCGPKNGGVLFETTRVWVFSKHTIRHGMPCRTDRRAVYNVGAGWTQWGLAGDTRLALG